MSQKLARYEEAEALYESVIRNLSAVFGEGQLSRTRTPVAMARSLSVLADMRLPWQLQGGRGAESNGRCAAQAQGDRARPHHVQQSRGHTRVVRWTQQQRDD